MCETACCFMDNAFIYSILTGQFLRFDAVHFWKLFKVKITKDTNSFPKVSVLFISRFPSYHRITKSTMLAKLFHFSFWNRFASFYLILLGSTHHSPP